MTWCWSTASLWALNIHRNRRQIEVAQVVQGYRSLLRREFELQAEMSAAGPFGNSGACNINVNCPEGDDWQVENKSVALIVNGGFAACSGALVNNTNNDGTHTFDGQPAWVQPQQLDLLLQPRKRDVQWQHRPDEQQHFWRHPSRG